MGLVLIPSEVVQKTDVLKNSLSNITENYRKALQAVLSFSNSRELDTETYNKLKLKVLDYHQLIVQGMTAAADRISEDAGVLEQSVGSEELDEDLLRERIRQLQNEEQTIRDQISMYQKIMISGIFGLVGSISIKRKIVDLQIELGVIQQMLIIVQKKLDILIEISKSTESLFDSAFFTLSALKAAICDAGVEISGVGTYAELDWRGELTKDIAEMDEKLRLFIEETLAAELQIDLDELMELYGDDVVERMIEILNENGIGRIGEGNAEKVIETVMEVLTGYQVIKVNGKYQYVDKDGINKALTTEAANELLQRQAKLDHVIKAALAENGKKEIGDNHTEYSGWYYKDGRGAAWCAIFVLWCMNEADLLDGEFLPVHKKIGEDYGVYDEYGENNENAISLARVQNLMNWYDKNGRYVEAKSGYEPKEGDLIIHLKKDGSGEGHTGIVLAYDKENQIVYTIEGNTGDQVAIRDYRYNGSYIDGYCINGGNLFGTIPEESGGETTSDR